MTEYRLTWHIWRTRRREGVRLSWAKARECAAIGQYLLTDDEITVQAVRPSSLCDDCDREALPGNDLCAVHADEVAETDEAYESWLDLRLGVL